MSFYFTRLAAPALACAALLGSALPAQAGLFRIRSASVIDWRACGWVVASATSGSPCAPQLRSE